MNEYIIIVLEYSSAQNIDLPGPLPPYFHPLTLLMLRAVINASRHLQHPQKEIANNDLT